MSSDKVRIADLPVGAKIHFDGQLWVIEEKFDNGAAIIVDASHSPTQLGSLQRGAVVE